MSKMTFEQQDEYVKDLRAMWQKVARIHGYESPQEVAILKVLCDEDDKLDAMKQHIRCPKCSARLYELSQYEFLNVSEDSVGRDVIEFKCYSCGEVGESFVYIERGSG